MIWHKFASRVSFRGPLPAPVRRLSFAAASLALSESRFTFAISIPRGGTGRHQKNRQRSEIVCVFAFRILFKEAWWESSKVNK